MWGPSSQRARVVALPPQGVLLDMFLLVLFVGLYAGTNAIVRVTSEVWPYPSVQADLSPQGALLLYGRLACLSRSPREVSVSRVFFALADAAGTTQVGRADACSCFASSSSSRGERSRLTISGLPPLRDSNDPYRSLISLENFHQLLVIC